MKVTLVLLSLCWAALRVNAFPNARSLSMGLMDGPVDKLRAGSTSNIPDPQPQLILPDPVPPMKLKLMPVRGLKFILVDRLDGYFIMTCSNVSSCFLFPTVLSQVRWLFKTLKVYVLRILGFTVMFIVNFIFSILFLFLKPWMRKIVLKRFAGFMMTYSMTPMVELKFDFCRMLTYAPFLVKADNRLFSLRTGMRTADEMIGTPRLPTDDVFISQVILRSPLAFYTANENNNLAHPWLQE